MSHDDRKEASAHVAKVNLVKELVLPKYEYQIATIGSGSLGEPSKQEPIAPL